MLIQKFLAGIANMAAFSREATKSSFSRRCGIWRHVLTFQVKRWTHHARSVCGCFGGSGISEQLLGFVFGVMLCFLGVRHHEKPLFGRRLVVSFQASRFTTGLNIQATQELWRDTVRFRWCFRRSNNEWLEKTTLKQNSGIPSKTNHNISPFSWPFQSTIFLWSNFQAVHNTKLHHTTLWYGPISPLSHVQGPFSWRVSGPRWGKIVFKTTNHNSMKNSYTLSKMNGWNLENQNWKIRTKTSETFFNIFLGGFPAVSFLSKIQRVIISMGPGFTRLAKLFTPYPWVNTGGVVTKPLGYLP